MPRPFVFPDPNDRSPNAPSVIVSAPQTLGLYNQMTGENARYVTDNIKNWLADTAIELGWDAFHHSGNQTVLAVNLEKRSFRFAVDTEALER